MMQSARAYRIRAIENTFIEHLHQSAYELIEIPAIASADLFLTRAGDKIIDRLFTFERHGRQLALRPEFTAAAAHHYIQQGLTTPQRWQFVGTVFSDDSSTPPRYQQHSIGAELIGVSGTAAEVEMIQVATTGLQAVGLTNGQLVVGHVGLQTHLLTRLGMDSRLIRLLLNQRQTLKNPQQGVQVALEHIEQVIAKPNTSALMSSDHRADAQQMLDVLLDSTQYGTTMGGRSREDIVARLLQKRRRAVERERIAAALEFLAQWVQIFAPLEVALPQIQALIATDDATGQRLFAEWQTALQVVAAHAGEVWLEPNLARNWEYYTGLVFGVRASTQEYVIGGGRYDELIGLLGGQPTPAVGFACYVDKLLPALAL
jgi:histidyl-tRNA synthetase